MNNLNIYCMLLVVSQPTLILLVRDCLTLRRHSTKIKTNNARETYSRFTRSKYDENAVIIRH